MPTKKPSAPSSFRPGQSPEGPRRQAHPAAAQSRRERLSLAIRAAGKQPARPHGKLVAAKPVKTAKAGSPPGVQGRRRRPRRRARSRPPPCPPRSKPPAPATLAKLATPASRQAGKYVYYFGDGGADGNGSMKPLLGGKGANLAEMTRIGLPGASRVHDHHRGLHLFLRQQEDLPARAGRADRKGARQDRKVRRQEARRQREPAPALRALRRARFHARHDGHDPQPRHERHDRRDRRREDRQRAFRLRQLPPLPPDVRRRGHGRAEASRRGPRAVRDRDRGDQARRRASSWTATLERRRRSRSSSRRSRTSSRSAPARASRRTRANSSKAPSAPCSARG